MNGRRRRAEKRIRKERSKRPRRVCPPALEWLAESVGGEVQITLCGNGHALVENHRGVAAFSQECIKVHSRDGIVAFYGSMLSLGEVRAAGLIISGRIVSVQMPGGEARD